jgi:hypothetical protein
MGWCGNYQFVNRAEREEIVRLFNGGESSNFVVTLCTPHQLSATKSLLVLSINLRWPGTVWSCLSRKAWQRVTWVGKIPANDRHVIVWKNEIVVPTSTPSLDGHIIAWRNGNNYGSYNYVVYQTATNNKEVMDLLEMLLCEDRQLPGFMARAMCTANQRILERLLRRE